MRQRHAAVLPDGGRPSAAACSKRNRFERERTRACNVEGAVKERCKTDRSIGFFGFKKRHGAHAQPTEPPCARMQDAASLCRDRRSRQDELTGGAFSEIDLAANSIPKLGRQLPLIDEPRRLPLQGGASGGWPQSAALCPTPYRARSLPAAQQSSTCRRAQGPRSRRRLWSEAFAPGSNREHGLDSQSFVLQANL